jgi:integrase/recombinase XerD
MASLYKRNGFYQIAFAKTVKGTTYQKKFSLGIKSKRQAEKKKIEYTELYEMGEIDPFSGWTPKLHESRNGQATSPGQSLAIYDLATEFIENRTQASEATKKNYKSILQYFQDDQVGKTLPVTMINEGDVRMFCFKENLTSASQANYLRHLKVFFNWLLERGYVKKDITKDIKKPSVKKNISDKTISKEDLEKIFTCFDNDMREKKENGYIKKDSQSRKWFKPVISIAYYGGLRLKEVVNLRWEHINLKRRTIVVTDTKSGQERTLPILRELLDILKTWKKLNDKSDTGLVFPSEKSNYEGSKMSKNNISRVYRKYVKDAKIKSSTNFHGLRHTAGTNFMRMGYDINEVAKYLGHSSLEVTRYMSI